MKAPKIIQPTVSIDCDCWCTSKLAVENNKFYFGTFGGTLNFGDIKTKNIIETPTKEQIESVAVYKDYVFAAGDTFIGMFDKVTGKLLYEFPQGHLGCIHGLITYKNTLISGSDEIKIWDLETKKCLATLECSRELVQSLIIKDNFLISGHDKGVIRIWNLISKELVQILHEHSWSVKSLAINGNTIISATGDQTIKIWDFHSGKCLNTLVGHNTPITSIALHKNYLFSSSEDALLKIWDLKQGLCLNSLKLDDQVLQLVADQYFLYTISDYSFFHQWRLDDLITHEPLEALIPKDYYVEKSRLTHISYVYKGD